MTGRQISARLVRELNEHANVVPAKPNRVLHPIRTREMRKLHDEIVAAEWPHHLARLKAADAKRARRRQRNRLTGR